MKQRIVITLMVETNMDAQTMERRIENFLDVNDLAEQLLGDESVEFLDTSIEVE